MDTFCWGVVGPGNIARKFANCLKVVSDARLQAVYGRSEERAGVFAREFGVARVHASIDDLIADSEVDAIYIATPHSAHKEVALRCLEGGKPVLCEKPLVVNAAQGRELIEAAQARGVFLMEGMWTRFLPVMGQVRTWLESGAIGELRMLKASFGFRAAWKPEGRLLNPDLAGGALLDVGIYPVALAQWAMGESPAQAKALASIGESGVDEQLAVVLSYSGGRLAVLDCAVRTKTTHLATLYGTEGYIEIQPSFWTGTQAALYDGKGDLVEKADCPLRGNGFEYEVEEVMRCVRAGQVESSVMSHAHTLANLELLDEIRRQIGLRYPFE